jgi:hypothetical protein
LIPFFQKKAGAIVLEVEDIIKIGKLEFYVAAAIPEDEGRITRNTIV